MKEVFEDYDNNVVINAADALANKDKNNKSDRSKAQVAIKKPSVELPINKNLRRKTKTSHEISEISKEPEFDKEEELVAAMVALLVEATNTVARTYEFNELIELLEVSFRFVTILLDISFLTSPRLLALRSLWFRRHLQKGYSLRHIRCLQKNQTKATLQHLHVSPYFYS